MTKGEGVLPPSSHLHIAPTTAAGAVAPVVGVGPAGDADDWVAASASACSKLANNVMPWSPLPDYAHWHKTCLRLGEGSDSRCPAQAIKRGDGETHMSLLAMQSLRISPLPAINFHPHSHKKGSHVEVMACN